MKTPSTDTEKALPRCVLLVALVLFAAAPALAQALAAASLPERAPRAGDGTSLTLRLELARDADLSVSDVGFSRLPGGRRCGITYTGVKNPKTIAELGKLGFRTTVYCSARTPAARVKALEDAGAEIALQQGFGYGSPYRRIQVAYDVLAVDRLALKRMCAGPVAVSSVNIGGFPSTRALSAFAVNRSLEHGRGYGAVYHDANLLMLYHPSPNVNYLVYLRRGVGKTHVMVDNRNGASRVKMPPNERLYYIMLAGQFQIAASHAEPGKVVRMKMRDFKETDLKDLCRVIGRYGKHPGIWHATEGEVGGYHYLKNKTAVRSVERTGDTVELRLDLERDLFLPFVRAPLSLKLPCDLPVRSASVGGVACDVISNEMGTHVVVPVGRLISDGCEMALETSAPDLTVPDEMPVTLTIRNALGKPFSGVGVEWIGSSGASGGDGLTVRSEVQDRFGLPPGAERRVKAIVRTTRDARFGIAPVVVRVTATVDGRPRTFLAGFEVAIKPRLGVTQDPYNRIPMARDACQYFYVDVSNKNRFLSHRAGPCRGTVRLDLPDGMESKPIEQVFELGESVRKTLVFKVWNRKWSPSRARVRPLVRLEGASRCLRVPFPGTEIIRDRKRLAYEPLDQEGLLTYWSAGDRPKGRGLDRAVGNKGFWGASEFPQPCIGVKGRCMGGDTSAHGSGTAFSTFKNIDYRRGTILCWVRKEPRKKNENKYKPDPAQTWKVGATAMAGHRGEGIFGHFWHPVKVGESQSFIALRRYRAWKGQPGYVEALYQCLRRRIYHVRAPFPWSETWRHVAVLWDTEARRLQVYIDGKRASGALHMNGKPVVKGGYGDEEWPAAPWDDATHRNDIFTPLHGFDGAWNGTQRDEFYIYNRPLSPEEIRTNMQKAKEE